MHISKIPARAEQLKKYLESGEWCWPLVDDLGIKKDGTTTPKFDKVFAGLGDDANEVSLKELMEKVQSYTPPVATTPEGVVRPFKFYESALHKKARKLFLADFNLYFFGEAGCGKTTYARELSGDGNYYLVSCSTDMVPSNLIGHFELQGEETIFVYGPLIRAMSEGKVLILDEFDRVSEEVASKLHEVLEAGQILVEQTSEMVSSESGFKIIATGNSDMGGSTSYNTLALDLASIDRFEFFNFGFSNKENEILMNNGADAVFAKKLTDLAAVIRKQVFSCVFSTRRLIAINKMVTTGLSFKDAFDVGYLSRLTSEEQKELKGIEKMLDQSSEVWTFDKATPKEVIEEITGYLSKTEASLFSKTLTLLANEDLLTRKSQYEEYIVTVRTPNPEGVEGEEFMGTTE